MSETDPDHTPAADAEAHVAELERRLAELEASTRARLIQAGLKAEAVRAGMVDLDGLKLVDTASLTLGTDGEVEGAAALMAELRRGKPWLFGQASASSVAVPPPVRPPRARSATEMSYEEWQAGRAELLRRR